VSGLLGLIYPAVRVSSVGETRSRTNRMILADQWNSFLIW